MLLKAYRRVMTESAPINRHVFSTLLKRARDLQTGGFKTKDIARLLDLERGSVRRLLEGKTTLSTTDMDKHRMRKKVSASSTGHSRRPRTSHMHGGHDRINSAPVLPIATQGLLTADLRTVPDDDLTLTERTDDSRRSTGHPAKRSALKHSHTAEGRRSSGGHAATFNLRGSRSPMQH